MTERTPAQIIGNDRLLQLIFEGYAVVPARLTDAMRERMALIADGPVRTYDEYWSAMLDEAGKQRANSEAQDGK